MEELNIKPVKTKEKVANRGMDWEKKITEKCLKYRKDGKAFIFKLPTEWQVQRRGFKIVSAFPKCKSLIDYFGFLPNGKAIAIEAKRTTNKTSFALSNIKEHQFKFFEEAEQYIENNYFMFWFKTLDRYFLAKAKDVAHAKDTIKRKSLPIKWFEDNCIELDKDIDFLQHIN